MILHVCCTYLVMISVEKYNHILHSAVCFQLFIGSYKFNHLLELCYGTLKSTRTLPLAEMLCELDMRAICSFLLLQQYTCIFKNRGFVLLICTVL